ncbi:MAG: DUF2953 domain-containing protein [Oscillospiraceae bacterium]
MTGWIIAGSIIVVLLVLLMTSVKARFEYSDELRLKISWLFLTIVRIPAKTKKMKRRDKKAAKDAEEAADAAEEAEQASDEAKPESGGSQEAETKNAEKKPEKNKKAAKSGGKLTLKDIFEIVKLIWDTLNTPLKRVLKATRISGFRLRIVVGGDDAAKAAISFGRVNMLAGSALAFLEGCFTLKEPDFDISCDFMSEETTTECEFTARLTVIAALAFLFWLLGRLVKNYLARADAQRAVNKLRK